MVLLSRRADTVIAIAVRRPEDLIQLQCSPMKREQLSFILRRFPWLHPHHKVEHMPHWYGCISVLNLSDTVCCHLVEEDSISSTPWLGKWRFGEEWICNRTTTTLQLGKPRQKFSRCSFDHFSCGWSVASPSLPATGYRLNKSWNPICFSRGVSREAWPAFFGLPLGLTPYMSWLSHVINWQTPSACLPDLKSYVL